jgi:hypothetical protein
MKRTFAERLHRWAQAQWPYALTATLLWCALLPLAGKGRAEALPAAVSHEAAEWPREWRGQALQPLARSAVEARFAERFPGRIARFSVAGGGEELVLREVQRPTRMLHPAADCWRGIGWQVGAAHLVHDDRPPRRCFEAAHKGSACACASASSMRTASRSPTPRLVLGRRWAEPRAWQAVTRVQGL